MNANGLHRAGSSRRSLGLGLEARGTPGRLPATAATTIVGLSAGMVGGASVASGSPRVGVGAASAALTFPAIPGADNIKSLILQKERELHEMTERRIATLEKSMKEKERELHEAQSKYNNLKADFQYNLKLIDTELKRSDAAFVNLQEAIRQRDTHISDLRVKLDDAIAKVQAAEASKEQGQIVAEARLKELQAASTQHIKTTDARAQKLQSEIESLRHEADERARAHEAELQHQRKEITEAFEKALARHDQDRGRTERDLVQQLEVGEAAQTKLRLDLEIEQRKAEALAKVELLETQVTQAQNAAKDIEDRAKRDARARDDRIAELEREKDELRAGKDTLFNEYESKMGKLLKQLHAVERVCAEQQTKAHSDLTAKQIEQDEAVRDMRASMEEELRTQSQKLAACEANLFRAQEEAKSAKTSTADRVAAVEAQIESERRQHETTRKKFEDATNHWKAQEHDYEQRLATEKKRLQEATIVAEAANDTIAALRHDMASLRRREDDLVSDAAAANARWEKKWADREAEVARMTEANAQKLDQERHRALQAKKDGDQALKQAQQESARLLEELQTAKTELRMLETVRRPAFAALASPGQFSEDMGPASPTVHNLANSFMSASGEGALGMMARAKELADLRQQVTTLEEENTRYRSIIADMRSQMEQLASGSASPAKASQQLAVTEAGWKQERQDLVAALTRQEQLVELLQRRMDEVRRGAFSDDAASTIAAGDMEELTVLRQHNRDLNATVADLRRRCIQATDEVASLKAQLETSQRSVQQTQQDASGAQDAAQQAIAEKRALQGTVDQLQAQLRRQQQQQQQERNQYHSGDGAGQDDGPQSTGRAGHAASEVSSVASGAVIPTSAPMHLASAQFLAHSQRLPPVHPGSNYAQFMESQRPASPPPPPPPAPPAQPQPQPAQQQPHGQQPQPQPQHGSGVAAAGAHQYHAAGQGMAGGIPVAQVVPGEHAHMYAASHAGAAPHTPASYYSAQGYSMGMMRPSPSQPNMGVAPVPPPRPPPSTPGLVWTEPPQVPPHMATPHMATPQPHHQHQHQHQQAGLDPRAGAMLNAGSPWQAVLGSSGLDASGTDPNVVAALYSQVQQAETDLERMVNERSILLDARNKLKADFERVEKTKEEEVAAAVAKAKAEAARQFEEQLAQVSRMQEQLKAEQRKIARSSSSHPKHTQSRRSGPHSSRSRRSATATRSEQRTPASSQEAEFDVRVGLELDGTDEDGDEQGVGVSIGAASDGASRRYNRKPGHGGNPYEDDVGAGGGHRDTHARELRHRLKSSLDVVGGPAPAISGHRAQLTALRHGRPVQTTNTQRTTLSQRRAAARLGAAASSTPMTRQDLIAQRSVRNWNVQDGQT